MGKQRNIAPRVAQSYDDAFKAFHEVVKQDKGNTGFGSLGSEASSTFRGYNTGIGSSDYDKNLSWNANIDEDNIQGSLNEFRADEQSWQDHLGIGAVRTAAKATTEVLKLPGVIGGIGIMAADGLTGGNLVAENEGFETAFNNQWIKFFDGLNEDVKEAMPVYVKESVKNGDFFTKIGSSATWATEGADGAGYMLGALAPGGLFKYFGGAAKIFGTSAKAAKLGTFGKSMEAGRKALKAAGITTKNIDQYMIPAFNTIAEAGAESKGVWDGMESRKGEARESYISKIKLNDPKFQNAISLKNEELDQLRRSGEISMGEYNQQSANVYNTVVDEMFEKDFKEQKALAAQNTFFKNTVILAGPNYIQAKLLFGKTPSKVLLDKIGGLTEKSIKNTVKQGVKNFAKGFASEGAEEVGQSAVEHRNIEQGLKFKLGDSRWDDYNPLTFGDDFIKTLGTTEGQMAGFLGGIMGAPMSAVGGYKQDVRDRVTTERLREKINGASTAYADIKNTNIYEQEEYTNPETGEVGTRDKEVDGKKVFIPENVAKVKNALNLIEKDSNDYDNAVEDGDVEKIEQFRNRGETNVILNFIGEDEVTLDALHEHLKVAFPTENTKDLSDEQVKVNKTNLERIDKIMSKAKHLQKDFVSFKDMSASILRINHPDITSNSTKEEKESAKKHLEDFLNRVGNTFLSERGEEYEAKQALNKLEKQKLELENSSTKVEIENVDYVEGKTEDIYKQKKVFNNPRLDLVNTQIEIVKEALKGYEENTNSKIWDNKYLNEQFAKEVELRKQIKEDNSPEQVAKNDEVITAVKSSTTEDEVVAVEKNAPKEVVKNPVIKAQIDNKKAEIIQAEKVKNAEEIATATQEDNDFNDTTVYTDLNGTEGSIITDELIPKEAENNTVEERNAIKNGEVLTGKGAQVISTNMETGELFNFVSEDYLNYERNPINKAGKEVGFEINQLENNNSTLEIEKRRQEVNDFQLPLKKNTNQLIGGIVLDTTLNISKEKAKEMFEYIVDEYYKTSNSINKQFAGIQSIKDTSKMTDEMRLFVLQIIKDSFNAKYDTEIKALPQTKSKVNPKVKEALDAFNRGDFSNPKLLIDYLPINVTFEKGVKAPMETRRANGKLDSKKDKDGKDQFYINPATEILRSQIINHLVNGGSINDIKTTIQDQYKGLLKVDDNRFANNNILELDGVKDLKYVRDNLYVVDSFGNLMNIQSGKTKTFSNGKLKPNAKGEIYLSIPQANGKPFPLKLNIKKINDEEANLLYYIYKEIITNNNTLDKTISQVGDVLKENILTSFNAELDIIGGNKEDIKLQDIIDLLIYQSDNIKSRMQVEKNDKGETILLFGENEANINNIDDSQNAIINYLVNSKRHQIKINPKFATDNTKTNLKSNNADYLKYLIDNNILSTNAVVNEPTFQGYTNIYLNTGVTVNNQPKVSESGVKVTADDMGLAGAFDTAEMGSDVLDILKEFETEPKVEDKVLNKIKSFTKNDIESQKEKLGLQNVKFLYEPSQGSPNFTIILKGDNFDILTFFEKGQWSIFPKQPNGEFQASDPKTGNALFLNPEKRKEVVVKYVPKELIKLLEDADKVKGLLEQDKFMEGDIKKYLYLYEKENLKLQLDYAEDNLRIFESPNYPNKDSQERIIEAQKESIKTLKEKLANLENKSENTRNVQENFVSLSEIKGTVENTQLNETQAEVFNENKTSLLKDAVRMAPIIEKYKESLKEGGKPLSARDEARIKQWAEENPDAYNKIC